MGYYDDFASIIREPLGQDALGAFTRFCSLLRFQPKGEKSQVARAVIFLGLVGRFPCKANGWKLSISLPEEKRSKWPALLPAYLEEGGIHPPMS